MGAYLIGLIIHKLPILFIFHLGLPLTASSFHFLSGLTSNGQFFSFFIWAYLYRPVIFIFHLGLPSTASPSYFSIWAYSQTASQSHFYLFIWTYLYCQSNSFSSFYLDLLSIASQISFRFSSGLTSNGQFSSFFIWAYL